MNKSTTQTKIQKLKSNKDQLSEKLIGSDIDIIYEMTSTNLFNSLDKNGSGYILKKDIIDALESKGILLTDPRIKETALKLKEFKDTEAINLKKFRFII